MSTNYYGSRHGGHSPGHIRDAFLAALDAYSEWKADESEPTVALEVEHEARPIPISKVCGLVWNCNDTLPSLARSLLEETGLSDDMGRWTFAAAARVLHSRITAASKAA